MLAAIFSRTGPAGEVLGVQEIETPAPGPGEVRVRVAVSGVNPTDWKERTSGSSPGELPFKVPNQDGAGTIEAVGDGVDGQRVGERVWVFFAAYRRQWGTAAQSSVVPADQAVALPDDVGDDLGASMGIPALSAKIAASQLMSRNVVVRFVLVYTMPRAAVEEAVADVSAALVQGALSELPEHRFALQDIAAAHDAVEQGVVGKVLVDVP